MRMEASHAAVDIKPAKWWVVKDSNFLSSLKDPWFTATRSDPYLPTTQLERVAGNDPAPRSWQPQNAPSHPTRSFVWRFSCQISEGILPSTGYSLSPALRVIGP